ncbi:MAG TPA: hypothetical protein PKO09_06365 [Anaerolineae bacterium]|nr:hypothetical protein [Anaerolineae bacterium]
MKKRVVLLVVVLLSVVFGAAPVAAYGQEAQDLPTLHVDKIIMKGTQVPSGNRVVATAWIKDQDGNPVPSAQVYIHAWKPINIPVFGMHATKPDGRVAWTMNSPYQGLWTFCVVVVVKFGYLYDAEANNETCDVIWYP